MHEPTIDVSDQSITPIANGGRFAQRRPTKAYASILSLCRARLIAYAGYGATHETASADLESDELDLQTVRDWRATTDRDSVILDAHITFRVIAKVTYRCSIGSTSATASVTSANDQQMNGNANGVPGEIDEIRILDGPHREKVVFWQADDDTDSKSSQRR